MDKGAITGSKNKWVSSFSRKAEEDSVSLSALGRASKSLGTELEKGTAFWCGFYPHLKDEGETEKMIE